MAALRKCDVAVTLEAAGFKVTDDGHDFFLNESAEIFATAWRRLNCDRNIILDAFDRAGPDVDHQLDAAMDVIHDLLLGLGIEPQEQADGAAPGSPAEIPLESSRPCIQRPESPAGAGDADPG